MDNALVKYSMQDIEAMASAVVASRMFPSIKTPEQATTLMLIADAYGLHPMKASMIFDVLPTGKPSMKGEAMLAEFFARGGKVKWLQRDDKACKGIFYSPGVPDGVEMTFTIEEARRAGLADKMNWRQYAPDMLQWRCVTRGVKATLPAAGLGLYPTEVAQDFDQPKPVPIQVEVIEAPKGDALSWSELADLYDKHGPGGRKARTIPMEDVTDWAESRTDLFRADAKGNFYEVASKGEHEPPQDEAPPPSDPPAGGELFGEAGGLQEGESGSIGAAPPAETPPPPNKGVEMGDLLFKMVKQLESSHPYCKCGDVMIAKLDKKGQPYGTCRTLWDALIAGDDTKALKKEHDYCRLRKDIIEGVPF